MSQENHRRQIAIIGAGPVGLEAALYGKCCGYEVRILEKGDIAHNLRQWKHVPLFSPFKLNHTRLGKKLVEQQGQTLPGSEAYLTGEQYLDAYVKPLANSEFLKPHIITDCEVLAISRGQLLKGEHIGDGQRGNHRFRILTRDGEGREELCYADIVIDASGTYGNHNWLGEGGIPALGELSNRARIQYSLEDISHTAKSTYLGKTTLIIGGGHSAATSIAAFKPLFDENPATKVIWLTRAIREQPVTVIPNDRLAERDRVARAANKLASHPNVRWIRNAGVNALEYDQGMRQFTIESNVSGKTEKLAVDRIVANVGYTPDNSIYRELQVHECYASRGPMKLAAALLRESASADCLDQTGKGPEVLKNPEPGFYIIGMKSYGKNSNFLLKIGYEQIRDVYKLISGDVPLDLYSDQAEAKAEVKKDSTGFRLGRGAA